MTHKILFASSRDGKDAVMSGGKKKKNTPPQRSAGCFLPVKSHTK